MNIFTKKFLLMVVFMFVASTGVAFAQTKFLKVNAERSGVFSIKDIPNCTNVKKCELQVSQNFVANIQATPLMGARLTGWIVIEENGTPTGECFNSTSTLCVVNMSTLTGGKRVAPKFSPFSPVPVTIFTNRNNDIGGIFAKGSVTVTSTPLGTNVRNCTNSTYCHGYYSVGTVMTITAKPVFGAIVNGWNVLNSDGISTGECSNVTSTTCVVNVLESKTVIPEFKKILPYLIKISTNGGGTITATSTPPGMTTSTPPSAISCINSAYCSGNYLSGTVITIKAMPSENYIVGWTVIKDNGTPTGECAGITATCLVTALENKKVKANFITVYPVTASTDVGGTITTTSTPPGVTTSTPPSVVSCINSTSCHGRYSTDSVITIVENPAFNARVNGWTVTKDDGTPTGECAGITATCLVTASEKKKVKARFSYPLTISTEGTGFITVTSAPPGVTTSTPPSVVSCINSTSCHGYYSVGTVVKITENPSLDRITEWTVTKDDGTPTGECTGRTKTCLVTASEKKKVRVKFIHVDTHVITVSSNGGGAITATSIPLGINVVDCTNSTSCYGRYSVGSVITIVGNPSAGARVNGWTVVKYDETPTGECAEITTTCVVTASENKKVRVSFISLGSSAIKTKAVSSLLETLQEQAEALKRKIQELLNQQQ